MVLRGTTGLLPVMLLCAFLLFAASCGGGGGTDITNNGEITNVDTGVPGLYIPGDPLYSGKPGGVNNPDPGGLTPQPTNEPIGDYGPNVYPLPLDSNGAGRVVTKNFLPGQKAAFVMVNTNRAYLDAHVLGDGRFPILPDSRFTISADLVEKGLNSVSGTPVRAESLDSVLAGGYSGIRIDEPLSDPSLIMEREAEAWGLVPYTADPGVKTTSTIQKGELRTFIAVPRRIGPPVILPDPDDPERDLSELRYPGPYLAQDGRLVTVGAHCLIFLSTEINNGHPDTIQFTEARLNRLAREFDTVIFPNTTAAFGPVDNYGESGIYRDVDRSVVLTGADFDGDGNVTRDLFYSIDTQLQNERKIIIFLSNADAGGFFTLFQPEGDLAYDLTNVGSTLYIGGDNFPANDDGWEAVYSVIAHEFQHKLFHDNGLPVRQTSFGWFNEGLSMLAFHINGYTVNSGKIIDWAIDGQLTDYLTQCNRASIPMDANPYFTNQPQYGGGFLFFLYLYEHYDPGVGKRIYQAAKNGTTDYIKLIEEAAQTTTRIVNPGSDGIVGTADDGPTQEVVEHDSFENLYIKWCLANFIDGIYSDNGDFAGAEDEVFDPRFHYNTIDLKGTINLATGTVVLPGVRREEFPGNGTYPVIDIHRQVLPWGADYVIFGNGDGRDLEVTVYSDPNFRMFMLPVDDYTFTVGGDLFVDDNFRAVTPGVNIN